MGWKRKLLAAGYQAAAATGADRWLGSWTRGKGVILMFHQVRPWQPRAFAPNRALEIAPEFLDTVLMELRRQAFDIVSLDAVRERLLSDTADRPFAALTFDDGYRDNAEHAWPVLKRHGAPWTLFVTTEFADGRGRLWWLELEAAIARLDRVVLALDGETLDVPSRSAPEKQIAFDIVYQRLRAGPEERLRAAIADLAVVAGVDASAFAPEFCLNWEELRTLAREPGVTIGAHTVSHATLAKLDAAAAEYEINGSKAILERRLGHPVRHLAYPFGRPAWAGAREFRLAREAGFVTAVTTRPGHAFSEDARHLHALPRVNVNGVLQSKAALRALLSGLPFLADRARCKGSGDART